MMTSQNPTKSDSKMPLGKRSAFEAANKQKANLPRHRCPIDTNHIFTY